MARGAFSVKEWGKRAVCLGAAVWMLCLQAGCAEGGTEPIVREDDLSPQPDAQERLELAAGNGKNYAYQWSAEDMEAALAQMQAQEEQRILTRLAELERMTPAELAGTGWNSVEQARKFLQEDAAQTLDAAYGSLRAEAALEPVFTAQEAANRAGAIFEALYGADLSQDILNLHCAERTDAGFAQPEALRMQYLVWEVIVPADPFGQSADRSSAGEFSCELDAATGEIIYINHHRSEREYEEWMRGPLPECCREDPEAGTCRWETDDPGFKTLMERVSARLADALSGSFALDGAQVTQISWSCADVHSEYVWNTDSQRITFCVKTDDGRTYQIDGPEPCHPIYREEAEPQCLLRGILITNITGRYIE